MVFKDLGRDALAFLLGGGRTLIGIYLYAPKPMVFAVVYAGYTSVTPMGYICNLCVSFVTFTCHTA